MKNLNFHVRTVKELKEIAKELGLKGYSKLKKQEVWDLIEAEVDRIEKEKEEKASAKTEKTEKSVADKASKKSTSNFTLLNVNSNAKTVKNAKVANTETGVLYLAPNVLSGINVCVFAERAKCIDPCLNTAGRGQMTGVQVARVRKTQYFFNNKNMFMNDLCEDIRKLIVKATNKNMIPSVRLNGTSDLNWEKIGFTISDQNAKKLGIVSGYYKNIFSVFPNVQFYDYTKNPFRNIENIPNYDLTFSYSGVDTYQELVQVAESKGMKMAVVFRDKETIPSVWKGRTVIDGDKHDARFMDPAGAIVALYAKGKAVKDHSGFVVDVQ